MGNMCATSRKCQDNEEMFGMLCKRPYDKPVIIKFEKQCTYYKKHKRKRSKSKTRFKS